MRQELHFQRPENRPRWLSRADKAVDVLHKNLQQLARFSTGFVAASIEAIHALSKNEGFWRNLEAVCAEQSSL
jgi:hypothetical protein